MQNPDYFDILPYGIFLINSNGIIISVNKAASDILSSPPGFFINRAIWDSTMKFADRSGFPITKKTHPAIIALRTGNRVGKVILSYESTGPGKKKWIECTATISNKRNHSSHREVLMSFSEITDILEIEERYKAIFDLSPFMLVLNDLETNKYIDVNRKFCSTARIEKESCLGKTPLELGLIPDPRLDELLKEAIITNRAIEKFELSHSANGKEYSFLLCSQIIEFHGKRYGLTALQDISDNPICPF